MASSRSPSPASHASALRSASGAGSIDRRVSTNRPSCALPPTDTSFERSARVAVNGSGDTSSPMRPSVAGEGAPPDGMVMLQFPTLEDAKAWYASPGYQAALPHRLASGDWRAFIVAGL